MIPKEEPPPNSSVEERLLHDASNKDGLNRSDIQMQKETDRRQRQRSKATPREDRYKKLALVLGGCCLILVVVALTCAFFSPVRRPTDNMAGWDSSDAAGFLCRQHLNQTGRARVFNVTSSQPSTSRGRGHRGDRAGRNRRYLNPVVDLSDDRYDNEYAFETVTEQLALLQRPVRDIPFPDRLPYWFHSSFWRRGDDLGPNGRTKLTPTENCDLIVVKKHERRVVMPEHLKDLPSTVFARCRVPIYPVFYGYHVMPNGVVFEAMTYDGISLQNLLERGVLGPRISGHNYKMLLRVIYKLIRNLQHLWKLGMVHRCLAPSAVIIRPVNPINFANGETLLHPDDEVVLSRLHCASLPSDRNDVESESPYASPEVLEQQADVTKRTTEFQLSQVFLDCTGSTITEEDDKYMVTINPSEEAFSWVEVPEQVVPAQGTRGGLRGDVREQQPDCRDDRPKAVKSPVEEERWYAEQFVRTLRFGEGGMPPNFEGLRFQQIFNALFTVPGTPAVPSRPAQAAAGGRPAVRATKAKPGTPPRPFGEFLTNMRLSRAFRAGSDGTPPSYRVEALRVYSVVRMVNGQPEYELRNFYPSLLPFAAIECSFAGDAVPNGPKLCSVSELEGLIAARGATNGVPQNQRGVYCYDPTEPHQNLPVINYPGEWDHARCTGWLRKKPVLTNTYGVVSLSVQFCTTTRNNRGHRVIRLKDSTDNSGAAFFVVCYANNNECTKEKDA